MVITGHLIIFLQQLTVCMCACIRTDRTCTHRTICTIMVTTQALLSCSSSNSSMNSTQSTSTTIYAYYSLSFLGILELQQLPQFCTVLPNFRCGDPCHPCVTSAGHPRRHQDAPSGPSAPPRRVELAARSGS